MYGLVNKSIKEFVLVHFGNGMWDETYKELGLSETQFLSLESNPDEVTFQIMNHICQRPVIRPPNYQNKSVNTFSASLEEKVSKIYSD